MRSFVLTAALSALTILGGLAVTQPAEACGTGVRQVDDTDFAQPPQDQVSLLLAEADRLDVRARQMDVTAASMDRNSESLAIRARELRSQAGTRGELDRVRLLAQAEQVAAQAAVARANALEKRAQASQLRVSAREMRERALRLAGVNGGRGWRGGRKGAETSI
jgi:hypothetical protein